MNVQIEVSKQDLCDLIVTAFEGGSNSWLRGAYAKSELPPDKTLVFYGQVEFYEGPFQMEVVYDDPEGEGAAAKLLGPVEFQAGLQIFAEKYPSHFGDFMNEDYDADTADVFMQCVVLGDVVYG